MRFAVFAHFVVALLLLVSPAAHAETWQAPVGGKALVLTEGRVACPGTSGDWTIEQGGAAVRPPAAEDAIGKSVELKVAPNLGACGTTTATLTLVPTGRAPAIDPAGTSLFVDDARVELRGRGLKGVVVRWQAGDRSGVDRCVQPQTDATGEKCAVSVGRGLPADPTAASISWLPAGARDGTDVVTFDATGRRAQGEPCHAAAASP